MTKIKVTLLFLLLASCFWAQAQNGIQTRLVYSFQDNFEFSDKWQYLSTDIYLYNGNKFTRVVNEIEKGAGRNKKKYRNKLEFIFITAKLKNIKVFGNENIIYPLYNFSFTDDKKSTKVQVSDNIEVIRIIDKLPVTDNGKNIDATIEAKAITNEQGSAMFNIVASQLINISKLSNPTGAILSLVGEFGHLLGSSSSKKEYRFSSTIRLHEGQNFDTKLHSVRVYVLVPPDAKSPNLRMAKLTEFLNNGQSDLEHKRLEDLINYKDYPFIVIANYKSLYKTDALSSNEITNDLIERRKQKINNAYDAGLVNNETYKQEMYLIEYLRAFAELKQNLNSYKLNYKNNISEANSKILFAIIQNYKNLKSIQRLREKEFVKNSTFQNIFKPEYQAIAASADLYLEDDHNLNNSKELVLTLLELENELKNTPNAAKRESYLARLHSVNLPATIEGEAITRYIKLLEDAQYSELFEKDLKKLAQVAATDEALPIKNMLVENAGNTNCISCREKTKEGVVSFNKRYDALKLVNAIKKVSELRRASDTKVTEFLKKKYCIDNNIVSSYPKDATPAYVANFEEKNNELGKQTEELNSLIKAEPPTDKLDAVLDYRSKIETMIKQLDAGFTEICNAEKMLCGCYSN